MVFGTGTQGDGGLRIWGNPQVCTPPPEGLVSWWPGDGNACDIVGPNNGELHGDVTFEPGMVGEAFHFDGLGSYVEAATAGLPTGTGNRTLEMWVRVDSFVTIDALFAGYGSPGIFGGAYLITAIDLRKHLEVESKDKAVHFSQWGSSLYGPALDPGTWHHVAVTNVNSRVGPLVTLYLDGIAVARSTDLRFSTPGNGRFYMGSLPEVLGQTDRLHGLVDEVSIYNRALSAKEIAAIYAAGSAGKCKEE
jgi:hypothetical protein